MKTLHRVIPIFLVFALGFCFLSASDAQVVENDAMLIPTPGGFLSEYQLGLSQTTSFNGNFDASGLFFFGINSGANDSFFFQPVGIDEVYALFVANPGDAIGPEFVLFRLL